MKSIINIIILILLSLSLYVIPLNTNAFNFQFSNILNDGSESASSLGRNELIFSKVNKEDFLYDPDKYEIVVNASKDLPEDLSNHVNYLLEFSDYDGKKRSFEKEELGEFIVEQKSDGFKLSFDLAKAKKYLHHSNYAVKVRVDCFENKFEDEFRVFFQRKEILLQNNERELVNYIPCFYSDKDLKYSVPIYRKQIAVSNLFSNVLHSMAQNPEELEKNGLRVFQTDGLQHSYMWFQNGSLRCKIREDSLKNIRNSKEAEALVTNMKNSFELLKGNYIINELNLSLRPEGKQDIQGFSIAEPFKIDRTPKVYLPFFYEGNANSGRYYWVPMPLEGKAKVEDDVLEIFDIYRRAPEFSKDERMISLLPDIEFYESMSVIETKLTIDLSDEMYDFMSKNPLYAEMIREGFALSLSSLPDLKSYEFWHDNELVEKIGTVKFGKNIQAPNTYNLLAEGEN